MCVFLPLITELISSGAETEQRLLSQGIYTDWDCIQETHIWIEYKKYFLHDEALT